MINKPPYLIRAAVQQCLNSCWQDEMPLCALAKYLEKLRLRGWQYEDIHAVEHTVVRVLAKLRQDRPEGNSSCDFSQPADARTTSEGDCAPTWARSEHPGP